MKKNKEEDDFNKYLFSGFTFGKKIRELGDIETIRRVIDPLQESICDNKESVFGLEHIRHKHSKKHK